MVEKKLIRVTDLGPGDGGKGGVVHKLCSHFRPRHVVKVGGAQGSHGVRTANGETFAFSQFGCGTLEYIRTHIGPTFVADPNGILNEAEALARECGLLGVLDLLTLDGGALCMTPWHQIASRLEELARKDKPRGTIGVGVGVAYRDAGRYPELALYARDLRSPTLRQKLADIRQCILEYLSPILKYNDFLPADREVADEVIVLLNDPGYLDWTLNRFQEAAAKIRIVDSSYMAELLARDGVVVVESSHGVLTDNRYGFYPHVSKFRTLPDITTDQMLRDFGYDGQVIRFGVTRAYQIRHGAGPMVTDDPRMLDSLLPGSHKVENRYQGQVRVGPLDCVALRYALDVCGGPTAFDALAVTWFDQMLCNGHWDICTEYQGADDPVFFESSRNIRVHRGEGEEQQSHQAALTAALYKCSPYITSYTMAREGSQEEAIKLCREVLLSELGVSVRMISLGPTEVDKVLC